jgi:DNA-binding CsgD family transcriptional regulator
MGQRLRAEQIYDAAIDDEAFEQLATSLAESIGARSGVLHWKDFDEETEEVSYSGYFSDDQMAAYEREFAGADLWSTAVNRPERLNRVWDCDRLLGPGEYEGGRIYNEWVRPMGDDTFHCLGGALHTERAIGEIGFHRGKGQGAFTEEDVHTVEESLVHLRRMVAVRSKLIAARRGSAIVSASLDVIGHAVLTLDPKGRLLHCNQAGETLLRRGDGLTLHRQHLRASQAGDHNALQSALDRALAPEGPQATGVLIRRRVGRPYELSILAAHAGGRRQIVAVVTDPDARNAGLQQRLRDLFELTLAEAEVAESLALGLSPDRIADLRDVSAATVHTQLKAIFSKMGCRRQSELVAMIGNLPRFQPDGEISSGSAEGLPNDA